MRKFLLDSGVLSAFLRRRGRAYSTASERRREGHRVGTCVPVIAEFAAGLERSASREPNLDRFRLALPTLKVWPFEVDAAFEYGRLFAHLVRVGRPMQVVDIQLAAIALTLGNCTVVTTDGDPSAVPGLAIENWADSA